MFEGLAKEKGLRFTIVKNVDECIMDFDPRKMLRILSNMIGNAIKFTDRGEVKVILGCDHEDDERHLRLEFIDSGIGIRPENQGQIFARYYQADTEQARVGQGTGIGLELVRGIVEILKGSIDLKSAPGVGSHFTIRIPVTTNAQMASEEDLMVPISPMSRMEASAPGVGENGEGSGHVVLLIEDNQDLQQLIIGQLSDAFQVMLANDGEEGVE